MLLEMVQRFNEMMSVQLERFPYRVITLQSLFVYPLYHRRSGGPIIGSLTIVLYMQDLEFVENKEQVTCRIIKNFEHAEPRVNWEYLKFKMR